MKKLIETNSATKAPITFSTRLRVGDIVIVEAGGNTKKGKTLRGETGKILRFFPKSSRVIVEGVNIIKRHKRARTPTDTGGVIQKEGSLHISNVMFYSAALKKGVRLKTRILSDGRKVRGYLNTATKVFEQIDV